MYLSYSWLGTNVHAFSYIENVGLNLVLYLADTLTWMTVHKQALKSTQRRTYIDGN